jgi:hypothetical protein
LNDVGTPAQTVTHANAHTVRTTIFISKATPNDDEFVLWLAPKLEAAGYKVFADVLTLQPGDRWRSVITSTLQNDAIKMLLCCRDSTLAAQGVLEEIDIASDLAKGLKDPRFIIPLRLEPYKKIFGIAGLQYIDFVRGWADGLEKLFAALKRQRVPCDAEHASISPNWEIYRRRGAIALKNEPERLTSNWLRIAETPDTIKYYEPSGVVDRNAMADACAATRFPIALMQQGIVTFQSIEEINAALSDVGRFVLKHEVPLQTFVGEGLSAVGIQRQDASNVVHSMIRQAWNAFCRERGLLEFQYSNAIGFHVGNEQLAIGQKVPWGRQGERRSSMLRNLAKGHVWQFGVTALPAFWPFPHLKLKSRVLFAPVKDDEADVPLDDARKQHRLRRSVCKGWRNKQWHGRLLAFIELVSGEQSSINLQLGETAVVRVEAAPMLFSSPVSTVLPNQMLDEEEELDASTLGRPEPAEEEP